MCNSLLDQSRMNHDDQKVSTYNENYGSGKKSGGRKGRLDHNILSYYRESLKHLEEAKASGSIDEDAELLLSSVFASLAREGRQLSQNQTGSRLAESLVGLADWPRLAGLLASFADNWPAVVEDRFAHRVLQAAIRRYLALRLAGQDCSGGGSDDGDDVPEPRQVWGQFASHMRLHYPEYLEHVYACHALRSYLLLLAGVLVQPAAAAPDSDAAARPAHFLTVGPSAKHESYDPSCAVLVDPPLELDGIALTDELEGLASRFLENKHVLSLIDSEITGPFLQVLMLVLKLRLPKRFRKFYKHLMKESGLFDATCQVEALGKTYTLASLLCNSRATYFLEQLLSLLTRKQLRRFLADHVTGREAALALHPSANFVLQRAIACCREPDALAALAATAVGGEDGSGGWLWPVLSTAGRQQQAAVQLVRRCRQLDCTEAVQTGLLEGVVTAAAAAAVEEAEAEEVSDSRQRNQQRSVFESLAGIGMAGCQVITELLQYPRPGRLSASLLALSSDRLAAACRCPCQNRTVEACLASPSVTREAKAALCDRLMPSLVELSCDKYGSRVMDSLWLTSDHQLRERIARRLAACGGGGPAATFERLHRDRFGRFTYQRFAPELLARRPADWRRLQQRLDEQQLLRRKAPAAGAGATAAAAAPESAAPEAKRRKR